MSAVANASGQKAKPQPAMQRLAASTSDTAVHAQHSEVAPNAINIVHTIPVLHAPVFPQAGATRALPNPSVVLSGTCRRRAIGPGSSSSTSAPPWAPRAVWQQPPLVAQVTLRPRLLRLHNLLRFALLRRRSSLALPLAAASPSAPSAAFCAAAAAAFSASSAPLPPCAAASFASFVAFSAVAFWPPPGPRPA